MTKSPFYQPRSLDHWLALLYGAVSMGRGNRAEIEGDFMANMADDPSLKITNMRDNTQVGEISAMPVVNEVTKTMDAINARGGQVGWQGQNGVEFSGAVQTGAFPNMGAKVRSLIQRENGMVSDRPALETQQPGYRIRG